VFSLGILFVVFTPGGQKIEWLKNSSISPSSSNHEGTIQPSLPDVAGHTNPEITSDPELPNPPPARSSSHLRFLTVATMLRNERPWLREWIEFYLMMGNEHFIIYDNGSTDLPLEILQFYIDQGIVTYIPWPPKEVPPHGRPRTRLEEWQYSWFKDSLETCLADDWTVHRHVPCQYAAFSNAICRTKGGVSRWLGIFDVDEYIFPRPTSNFTSISELLRRENENTDHLAVFGGTFGTSGHIDHPARRIPGSPLQALITESYTYRAELHRSPKTRKS